MENCCIWPVMIQWIKEKEKKRGRNVGRKRIWLLPSHGFITSRIVVVVARGNERLNERNRFGPRDGWGKVAAAAKTSQREAPRNADATKPPNRVISFIWNVFFWRLFQSIDPLHPLLQLSYLFSYVLGLLSSCAQSWQLLRQRGGPIAAKNLFL